MNWLDLVLIAILAASVISSFSSGFTREVIGLAAGIGGLICGAWFYRMAGDVVRPWVGSREVANLIGFLLILVAVIVLGWVVGLIAGAMMKAVKLSWLDKLMGAGFGLARGVFVCVAVITAIVAFAPGKDEKSPPQSVVGSTIAPYMIDAAHTLTAAAPKELRDEFAHRYEQVKRIWEETLKHGAPRRLPESEI
jgi:membrane protein required for colicin V production